MEMRARVCPLCQSEREDNIFAEADFNEQELTGFAFASRKIPEYMHYRLLYCKDCDLIYATPVPSSDWLVGAYEEADYDSEEEASFASKTYADFLRPIMSQLPDLDGALDIGTGNGSFLEELIALGFTNVAGVEPSCSPVKAAKEHIRPLIRQSAFQAQDFTPGQFRLATCFQTLEHLYDPLSFVREIYSLLKRDGAAYFICHNHRAWTAKLLGLKSPIFDIEHLQLFSATSLRRLFAESGFTDISIQPLYNCYPLHYWIKLFPMPVAAKKRILASIKGGKLGQLPIRVPAGNIAGVGYKR